MAGVWGIAQVEMSDAPLVRNVAAAYGRNRFMNLPVSENDDEDEEWPAANEVAQIPEVPKERFSASKERDQV